MASTTIASRAETRSGAGLELHLFSRPEEIDALLPPIAEAHDESPFGRYAFSAEKARRRLLATLEHSERQVGFYATYGGRVVGFAAVAVGPHYLSDEGVVATCLTLNVRADIRKSFLGARTAALLLRAIKGWAAAKGATMLTIHGTSGQMLRMARGARPIGVNVALRLDEAQRGSIHGP